MTIRYFTLLILTACYVAANAQMQVLKSISINADAGTLASPVSKQAIDDVTKLLSEACKCTVQVNLKDADVVLNLPNVDPAVKAQPIRFETGKPYPVLHYPETDYRWTSKRSGTSMSMTLETKTNEGISAGLYGLLQEKLGFMFYHPRANITPQITTWPLGDNINWEVKARFHKRGFHIHAQHPLEITEQLMDEDYPNAMHDIKEYLDWLARNGQNYFEFNLLENINRKKWPAFAKEMVDYGHSRGILMGIDLSMHMIQQKTFQLYRGGGSKKKQIEKNTAMLNSAGWDAWNLEFSKTEFSSGNVKKKTELQLLVTDLLTNKYHVKLMGRKHVVQAKAELGGEKKKKQEVYEMTPAEKELDKNRAINIHTVMWYTIAEKQAPVYRNENLRHMLDLLLVEQQKRETWYYPESAYWITFDNSVPMALLPYLKARLDDILLMDSLGITGHLTFSSGWEWGYWLTDWSIARWSWKQNENGNAVANYPEQYANAIFTDRPTQILFKQAEDLQQKYIKDDNLIQYMAPSTVTDEFPEPYRVQFQPRPRWTYKYIRNKASAEVLDSIRREAIEPMLQFYDATNKLVMDYNMTKAAGDSLNAEVRDGIEITGLRAKHRVATLNYLLAMRQSKLNGTGAGEAKKQNQKYLDEAKAIRLQGVEIVKRREATYRYPVENIGRRHKSHTAYAFGYLFPASELHFWNREELQARNNKWSPFYKNIYNLLKIIGFIN
ncbi:MAG TPA: hypothetical protein VK154_14165 [Chitinophagales bacterium]|nr:hypothetical protein [Chitinophagales bacterium]